MGNFFFERECRTPYSESYTIVEEQDSIGSIDLHYTQNIVHATLCVSESVSRDSIQELIDTIDDELLDSSGISRNEFIVHVHQGRDIGIFSNPEFGQNGGDELH